MGLKMVIFCFFLCFSVTKGLSLQQIFVQTNTDLVLHVPDRPTDFIFFFWKFNTTKNIITLATGFTYKDRVEFFPQNHSLLLKNLQLSDTGVYTAVYNDGDEDKTLATYTVTVEAPVSAVSVSVSSVSNSSQSCNFTVICQTEELYNISSSFTCLNNNCKPRPQHSGHAPSGPSSLNVSLSDRSILCNHSNHVSWKNDTENIPQVCFNRDTGSRTKDGGTTVNVGLVTQLSPASASHNHSEDSSTMYCWMGSHNGTAPDPNQNPESLHATVAPFVHGPVSMGLSYAGPIDGSEVGCGGTCSQVDLSGKT
ncbi:hypothetical protein WMY93_000641 [Mugilogobius chulae]|uniref:Immunoglobulin subtype domain-containing protein n=1 Tax=Mugilogobius chulae TaxID=88201 RepID=A0AAW0Q845_9GOBI